MTDNSNKAESLYPFLDEGERDVFGLVARRKPLKEIAERVGLSRSQISNMVHEVRFALGANDDLMDDYFDLLEQWQAANGYSILGEPLHEIEVTEKVEPLRVDSKKVQALEEIERTSNPDEMRALAGSLMKLADAIDQDWSPDHASMEYFWPSTAARIERNSLELAKKATLLIRQAKMRERYLPPELIGEPVWNMLLDLFVQFAGGAKVSSKSLCIAADCPATSALRHIKRIEAAGLIERIPSPKDGRVMLFSLTKTGVVAVGRALERLTV